jgi:hypothetical protein
VWVVLLAMQPVGAQEVRGFAEVRGTASLGVDGVPWQLVERVRPEVDAALVPDRVNLTVTVEAALAQGRDLGEAFQRTLEASDLGPALAAAGCAWPAHVNEPLRIDGVADWLWVDRLYVDTYSAAGDLRLGRQAVNWGSARFFNPTDPFPEVLLAEPWRPRRGVNAVRATIPLGEQHQLQLVGGANDTFTAERAAGRATVNVLRTDLSVVGAWRGEVDEGLVGIDVRGTLGVGFWIEGAVHVRPEQAWEEVAVGIDYSLPVLDTLVLTAQYYRSGRDVRATGVTGAVALPDCPGLPEPPPPEPFPPAVSGRDYGLVIASLGATPDLAIAVSALQNLGDGTGFVFPTITVRPTAAVDVSLSAQVPYALAGPGELRPGRRELVLDASAILPGAPPTDIDLSGLVPEATAILWTRLNF